MKNIYIPNLVIILLVYFIPTMYGQYKNISIIEYDQHFLIYTTFITIIIIIFKKKFRSLNGISFYIPIIILLSIILLVLTILFHYTNKINDSYRFIEITISLFVILCVLYNYIHRSIWINKYLPIIFLPPIFESFKAIKQFITNGFEGGILIQGSLANSGTLGNYLITFFPLIVAWTSLQWRLNIRLNKHKHNTYFLRFLFGILGIIIICFALIITYARAAWLGCATALVILAIMLFKKYNLKTKFENKNFSTLLWIILCLTIPALLYILIRFKPLSVYGRLQIYLIDIYIIKNNIFLGIGLGGVFREFNEYQATYFSTHSVSIKQQILATNTFEAFNILLQVIIENGLLGILFCLIIFLYLINTLIKQWKYSLYSTVQLSAISSFIGIIVASLFSNPFHCLPILINTLIIFILMPLSHISFSIKNRALIYLTFLSLFFISILFIYRETVRVDALRTWLYAFNTLNKKGFKSSKLNYQEAYLKLRNNGFFNYNYGVEEYLAGDALGSIKHLQIAKHEYVSSELYTYLGSAYLETMQYHKAEDSYIRAIEMVPALMYPKYQLFQLYKTWNKHKLARNIANTILIYPVKISSQATYQMQDTIKLYLNLNH